MEYGKIPGVTKPVPRIIQGSTMIGMEGAFEVLDAVFEQGCNAIDSAAVYGNEGTVAEWVHSRGVRDEFVIITKGAHHGSKPDGSILHRCNEKGITEDIEASLNNLKTDYIDLYILHRDDPATPVAEIVECLNEHQKAGRINAFGGSNWAWQRVRDANAYAEANGLTPFAVSNPNFSLAEMYEEPWPRCISISGPQGEEARAWYSANEVPLLTWSSMAGGFWSGDFTREMYENNPDEIPDLIRRCYCGPGNFDRLERVQTLAQEKGFTVPQVALAYAVNQPLNIFPLIAARSGAEFRDNAAALEIKLTAAELAWLELKTDER